MVRTKGATLKRRQSAHSSALCARRAAHRASARAPQPGALRRHCSAESRLLWAGGGASDVHLRSSAAQTEARRGWRHRAHPNEVPSARAARRRLFTSAGRPATATGRRDASRQIYTGSKTNRHALIRRETLTSGRAVANLTPSCPAPARRAAGAAVANAERCLARGNRAERGAAGRGGSARPIQTGQRAVQWRAAGCAGQAEAPRCRPRDVTEGRTAAAAGHSC